MKKALISILILLFILLLPITFASTSYTQLITADGTQVYYRSGEPIMIPTTYDAPERQFRGVWVSQYAGDVKPYSNQDIFKAELLAVLDTMEKYRLNTIIYHLRIMNDALYKTNLSPISHYVQGIDFDEWDYLEWFIDECHRRGIEFHAWLNPYRIQSSVQDAQTIANRYKDYPLNPASNPKNIIVGTDGAILNPGEPKVREFIIDTCMELIANYDIDAIHFDDYFYASMNPNADIETYNKYKNNSQTTNIEDWRREQVDIFIRDLSKEIRAYNRTYDRQVQLGISPSGVWKSGNGIVTYDENGTAITNGSNTTTSFNHYGAYLYSDTKKWIDEEWIDYILPQVYWAFTHPTASHADIVDWWAKVVKYKDVNLYIGIGLYMSSGTNTYSWGTDPYEVANQILFSSANENVDGISFYKLSELKVFKNQQGLNKILNEYWTNPALTPVVYSASHIAPNKVSDVNIVKTNKGFTLSWKPVSYALKYAIYRSESTIDINNPNQLVGVVGYNSSIDYVVFNDETVNTKDYQYAIVSVSGTGIKSEGFIVSTDNLDSQVDFPFATFGNLYLTGTLFPNYSYQLRFTEAQVLVGDPLTYEVYYSYDQTNWVLSDKQIRKSGNAYSIFETFPNSSIPLYYKVIARNELGTIESDIIKAYPTIGDMNEYMKFVFEIISGKISQVIPSGS